MPSQGFSRTQRPAIDIADLDRLMLVWDDGIFDEAAELLPILEKDFMPAEQPPKAPDVRRKDTAESPDFAEAPNGNDTSPAGESMPSGTGPALAA